MRISGVRRIVNEATARESNVGVAIPLRSDAAPRAFPTQLPVNKLYGNRVRELLKKKSEKQELEFISDVSKENSNDALDAVLHLRDAGLKLKESHWMAVLKNFVPKGSRMIDPKRLSKLLSECAKENVKIPDRMKLELVKSLSLAREAGMIAEIMGLDLKKPTISDDMNPQMAVLLARAFGRRGEIDSMMQIVRSCEESKQGAKLSMYQYAITALAKNNRIEEAEECFQKALKKPGSGAELWNIMMGAYNIGKKPQKTLELKELFDEKQLIPMVSTFNCLLHAHMLMKKPVKVVRCFEEMKIRKLEWDGFTATTMLKAMGMLGDVKAARKLFEEAKRKNRADIHVWNAFLEVLTRNHEMATAKEELTNMYRMKKTPDVVSYNTLILGFVLDNQVEEAISYFEKMRREGLEPTARSYQPIVMGLVESGDKGAARMWLDRMTASGLEPQMEAFQAVMTGYAKSAKHGMDLGETERAFETMRKQGIEPNEVTYGNLMEAYARHGKMDLISGLFRKMEEKGMSPNSKAYDAIILAAGRQKKPDEATKWFVTMKQRGIEPSSSSYHALMRAYAFSDAPSLVSTAIEEMEEHDLDVNATAFSAILDEMRELRVIEGIEQRKPFAKRNPLFAKNSFTNPSILEDRLESIDKLINEIVRRKFPADSHLMSSSIQVYTSYNEALLAKKAFDRLLPQVTKMEKTTVVQLMIEMNRRKLADKAIEVYNASQKKQVPLDQRIAGLLITSYGLVKRVDLLDGMEEMFEKRRLTKDSTFYSALVQAYILNGENEKAVDVILKAKESPDIEWNTLMVSASIEAFAAALDEEATKTEWLKYQDMKVVPPARSVSAILKMLGELQDYEKINTFVQHLNSLDVSVEPGNKVRLVEALLRCGEYDEAMQRLEQLLNDKKKLGRPEVVYSMVAKHLKIAGRYLLLQRVNKYFGALYPKALKNCQAAEGDALEPGVEKLKLGVGGTGEVVTTSSSGGQLATEIKSRTSPKSLKTPPKALNQSPYRNEGMKGYPSKKDLEGRRQKVKRDLYNLSTPYDDIIPDREEKITAWSTPPSSHSSEEPNRRGSKRSPPFNSRRT